MKKSTWSRDLLVMLTALCVAGVAVVWVQRITGRIDGVAMLIFMLAVFVTSMYTDGYLWGVLASLASVLAVNFAFFTPYFAFNFTLPENLFSGLVMLAVSIMTSTQWLNRMVENLLSVTRFDGEQVAVKKTPTVLEELLDAVLVKFKKRCPDVPVQLELPEDFVMIPMDSMLIQQVLMNLLENAVLHAEGMTTLTLRVFTLGSRAVFEVKDDGCGIPKERLRTLFSGTGGPDPNAPADSGKHGMGIGLSVCAAIIKAHGGEIDAESRPGEGTTIRFWLETEKIELEDAEDEQ